MFPHLYGVKIIWRNSEYGGKNEKLLIGDVSKTNFNLPQRRAADVKTGPLAASGQLLLAEFQLAPRFPNLGSDDIGRIFFSGHGSTKSSLTLFEKLIRSCYARVTERKMPSHGRAMGMKLIKSVGPSAKAGLWQTTVVNRRKGALGEQTGWSTPNNRTPLEIKRSILRKLVVRIRKEKIFEDF